jgi:hypothetical protein
MATYNLKDWVPVGNAPVTPSIPPGTELNLSEWQPLEESGGVVPGPVEKAKPDEPILTSAGKDFKQVASGIYELGKAAGHVFAIGEENTLLKMGRYFEDAYEKGELADDAWNFTKAMIITPLKNIGEDIEPIIEEGISKGTPQAAENIARRPFSFALDVLSLVGLGKLAKGAVKGGAAAATGKPMSLIEQRVAKAEAVKGARSPELLVGELDDALNTLNSKIGTASDKALAALPDSPSMGFSVKEVSKILDDASGKLAKDISDAGAKARTTLARYKDRVTEAYPEGKISPREVKKMVQQLDSDIDWNTAGSGTSNKVIQGLRREVDTTLKTKFPEYQGAMKPLSDLMKVREESTKLLGIKRVNGEWMVPDAAGSKIDRLFKGVAPKEKSKEILGKFGRETGLDIVGEMEAGTLGKVFDRPVTQGSWRPVVGGALGGMATGGSVPGILKGAAAGALLDKWGGVALGKAIDVAPGTLRAVGGALDAIPSPVLAAPAATEAVRRAMPEVDAELDEEPEAE